MTRKLILASIIATAFITGIITTGTIAYGHLDVCAQASVPSQNSVWHALCDLQTQINNIPAGPPGPAGSPGPPGPPGPSGAALVLVNKTQTFVVPPSSGFDAIAYCDPGQKALSGGYEFPSIPPVVVVSYNKPAQNFDGWFVRILSFSGFPLPLSVHVTCANLGP